MKFIAAITTIAAVALAAPTQLEERQSTLCSSGTALCCQLDVLGVVDATCEQPSATLTTADEFQDYCAESGRTAECCTLSLSIAGLVCSAPVTTK
ncbi:fungal hydrophobin [Diplodia corticola]|uniref:Fungal hydrophobin n=1 Tax=Diplodia corticola TaxID=236234 RepID=A0A1J9RTY0_9PEZI|nr:fungal hydrophobin [Diplodia corticola]OJD36027.1 fungal hydrophobin [Diplodia corticola]